MPLIVDNLDLSTGEVLSTAVANANNVRIQWKISGAVDEKQVVELELLVSDDGGVNYETLFDGADRPIRFKLAGNSAGSRNYIGVNSALLKVKVTPEAGSVGNIDINTSES
ncbi:hypothetical protein [Sunxiuqinia indica]|uniref:hypothetical protein n=1 Tax=Sunxiuqinia indica TaxID=2692584 RepID=UPI001358641B|nr:hypothetical protein [Sunxiuqinia indica]